MKGRVRVGIMGAGSVGCFLGAQLALAPSVDVVMVGRSRLREEIETHGLHVQGVAGEMESPPPVSFEFTEEIRALHDCDIVLCCVKSAHTEQVAREMAVVLRDDALVVSMQNGVRNPSVLRQELGERPVLAGIVDFNVVSQGRGLFEKTMSGPLRTERWNAKPWQLVIGCLRARGVGVSEVDNIEPEQWTKLLVNLNNAVSALSGAATPTLLLSPEYRKVIAALMEEGVSVLRAAEIRPAKLRGIPVAWMPRILRLPTPIVRLVTRAQLRASNEARSSMWEDLERGRLTEVDYLNGELISLGERVDAPTPYNRKITSLVRDAESAAAGSPGLSGERLWNALSSAKNEML